MTGNHGSLSRRRECRLCGSPHPQPLCAFADTPLANEFVSASLRSASTERFPLAIYRCEACGHVQLLDVVDPERLFRNYVYVSSTSPVFVDHFHRYAEAMIRLTAMPAGSTVVEIGSNDGVLLRAFQQAGMRVLGIDPARAIAAEATRHGIETLPEFFTRPLATRLRQQGYEASLVVANNVFAHADDLRDIVEGVAHLLHPEGLFVVEVSYLLDVVEKTLFDTIYHEHLSYHSVKPLVNFFARQGMKLIDAVRVETHGGSLRGLAALDGSRWSPHARVQELMALEASRGLYEAATYQRWFDDVQRLKAQLVDVLGRLKAQGKTIVGFGAPAKATTLMFHFGIGAETLDYLVDDSPWKQGLYSPGHHLPIVPSSRLYDPAHRPDYVLILAWNFAEAIIKTHHRFLETGGHFILPLPRVEIR